MLSKLKEALGIDARSKGGLKSQLIFGASGILGMRVGSIALSLLNSVFLARLLGPAGLGVYSFSMSMAEVLVVPSLFGLQWLLVREIPVYQSQQAWAFLRGLLRRSNQVVLLVSIFLATLIILVSSFLNDLDSSKYWSLCLAMLLVPVMAQTRMYMAVMRGHQHVVLGQLPQMLLRPGIFLSLLCAAYFIFRLELQPQQALALHLLAAIAAMVFILFAAHRAIPDQIRATPPEYQTNRWFWSALPLMFVGAITVINNQVSILMLEGLATSEQVGLYRVAQRGSDLITFSYMAVNIAISPTISKLYTAGDMQKIQKILTSSVRAILAFSLPVALVLIFLGPWLLSFVFGSDFASAANCLAVLSMGRLLHAGLGSVGVVLNMTGFEKDTAKGVAIAAVVNIVLNLVLIPVWGEVGAAVATSCGMLTSSILLAYWVYRRTGLHTTALGKMKS